MRAAPAAGLANISAHVAQAAGDGHKAHLRRPESAPVLVNRSAVVSSCSIEVDPHDPQLVEQRVRHLVVAGQRAGVRLGHALAGRAAVGLDRDDRLADRARRAAPPAQRPLAAECSP